MRKPAWHWVTTSDNTPVNPLLIPKQPLTLSSQIQKPIALNSMGGQGWETFGQPSSDNASLLNYQWKRAYSVSRGFLRHCSVPRKLPLLEQSPELQTCNSPFGASLTSCIPLIGLICRHKAISTDISKVGVYGMISSPTFFWWEVI